MPTFIIGAFVVGGAAAGAAAIAGTAVFAAFQTAFITSLVIGAFARATQKKPKQPGNAVVQSDSPVTIRQAASPWQVAVGNTRVGGVLTFRYISPDRRFWHMVITLACHPCQAVDEVWFNDEKLSLDASGNLLGRFAKSGPVVFSTHFATVPGSPYQVTVPGSVVGVSAVYISGSGIRREVHDSSPNAPQTIYQYSRAGSTFTFHSGWSGKGVEIRYYDAALSTGSYGRVQISTGNEGSAQPFPDLVAESNGNWTNGHLQYGHTKLYVRLEANPEVWPTGVPNVTAVVRGSKIYDPRTGNTAYSSNAALWVSHYLTESTWGYGVGASYASEIDETDLISAANSSDDTVSIVLGGTEPRYQVNGSFLVSEQPKTILERLLAASGGTLVDQGDKWRVNVAVYSVPTVTLTETHLAGAGTINPHVPISDDANGAKGIYTAPNSKWQPEDFPAYAPATYLSADNNERRWKDMDLSPFVTSASQAQRLAKIDLLRTRSALTEAQAFKLYAWRAVPGRTVARTDTQLGWSAKAFEVLDSELAVQVDAEGAPTLVVQLTLKETAAAIYDWSTAEEVLDTIAPNTGLPDPSVVPPLGAPTVSESLYLTSGSAGVKSKATVSWMPNSDQYVVNGGKYQVEYKLSSSPTWLLGDLLQTTITSVDVFDLAVGTYDFRVRAYNGIGVSSVSTTTTKELVGLIAPPSNISNFTVQSYAGMAKFTWSKLSSNGFDLAVLQQGRVLIRWSPKIAGASWDFGSLVNPDGYPGDGAQPAIGPLMTGTYMAKAWNGRNFSVTEATFVVTEALITGLTTMATVTESPTYAGAKSNVAAVGGGIQLDGTTLIDAMLTNIDTWASIDSLGGVLGSGSYNFGTKLDLGSKTPSRLFSTIDSVAFSTDDLIDSRTDPIDTWGLVDGVVIEDAEIQLWVRHTDDDPNGAPSWSAWEPLGLVADYNFRGFDFRLDFATGQATHNRTVTTLSVAAKH